MLNLSGWNLNTPKLQIGKRGVGEL